MNTPTAWTIPTRTQATDRAWLRRRGLEPPPGVPGFGANGTWVPPAAWLERGRHRRRIDPARLRADLPWLQRMLRESYAGWTGAARRGWKWKAFFIRWDRYLRRIEERSVAMSLAFAPWREFLSFQPDGHTGPLAPLGITRGSQTLLIWPRAAGGAATAVRLSGGRVRRLRQARGEGRLLEARTWRAGRLEPVHVLALPAIWGAVSAARIGGRWRPVNSVGLAPRRRHRVITELAHADANRPCYRRLGRDAAYLRIPSLTPQNAARLRRLAARVHPATARLVIDLRGNGGGDQTAAMEILRACLPGIMWAETAEIALRWRDTPMARALRWGWVQGRLTAADSLSAAMRRQARQFLDETVRPPTTPEHHVRLRLSAPAAGPAAPDVLLLVDGRCGSDGELLVWLLRRQPGVVVAGSCTFGAAQFVQPGDGLLPQSGVAFRVALGETDLYGDGRAVDGHGLPVDVVLPDARSQSRDSLLKLMDQLWPDKLT